MSNSTTCNSNNSHSRWWSRLAVAALLCLALAAAACGDSESTNNGTTSTTETTATSLPVLEATSTTEVEVTESQCPKYEDPRGSIFQAYQNEFDRCHPFQSLDVFCTEHDAPSEALQATDTGITEDAITLVHIRSRLEQLASIGFATDVGDPARMFNTFAWYVNEMCGGVHGRKIDLKLVEVDSLGGGTSIDALRNAACISATEDHNAVIVMNSSGFQGTANLCIAEEHETAFISTQGQNSEFIDRGEERLISMSPTLEESLSFLVAVLQSKGALDGKTIGVVAPDTPGQKESVERGLIDPLEAAGIEVAEFSVIGCGGQTSCSEGNSESVRSMREKGVDVIFPTLNVVSLPQYLGEMVSQGFEPGDVQFYNSDFNSQASNTVVNKIIIFGGAAAGELYNGAIIVDDADPAAFHEPGWEPRQFNKMCADVYDTYNEEVEGNEDLTQPPHDPYDPNGNTPHGMIVTICSQMRVALRAIYDAGPNPSREDIYMAMSNLGAIDFNNMVPNSIEPGKPQTTDVVHTLQFTYPCASGAKFAVIPDGQTDGTCIVNAPGDEWLNVSR